jgi:O-antigen/teichoic acid export membrane protein
VRAAPDSKKHGELWSVVGTTATTKVLVMGLSGLLGIVTSRLIIQHFGTDAYAQYGLLTSLPSLLPFADLGIAAVVINAVASSNSVRTDDYMRRTIVTAIRILLVSGGIIVLLALAISLLGWWPLLLGNGLLENGGSLAAFGCLAVFGLMLPLTVGQRILVGLKKTNLQVASQSVVAPFMILSIGAMIVFSVPADSAIAVFSYVASGLVSVICLIIAARSISPQLGAAFREVPRLRSVRGVPVIALAWPMLVQMIALPLAMQTERLLLSHLSTGNELAQFNLASQLFGVILQTIAAAGIALWPLYAKARARSRVESPLRPSLWFLAGGLVLGGALAAVSPWVVEFVADGRFALDLWLVLGFVVFVGLQATKYPLGMYMTDARGLRFQVLPIVLMVPLNLGLSWWMITWLGAGGAIIASAVSVAVCQVIPNFLYVRRDLARRRAAGLAADAEPSVVQGGGLENV